MVTVGAAGREKLYVLRGYDRYGRALDTVERWEEGSRAWEEEERMTKRRANMGVVAVN